MLKYILNKINLLYSVGGLSMEEILKGILYELQKRSNDNKKLTYTLKECSVISGIGLNTLQEEISKENSDFPFFKIGKKVMVNKSLFHKW